MSEIATFVLVIVACGAFAAANVAGIVLMKRVARSETTDERSVAPESGTETEEESTPTTGRPV